MSGNMESILMGGDSSSGESDDEVNLSATTTSTSDVAVAAPPKLASIPAPSPVAAAAAAAPTGGPPMSHADEMKARLKSLYSASKSSAAAGGSGSATSASPQARPTQQPPAQQMQRQAQQQSPAQQIQHHPQQQRQNYTHQQHVMLQGQPAHQQQPPLQNYPTPTQNRQGSQPVVPPPQRPPNSHSQQQQQQQQQQRDMYRQRQQQQQQHRSSSQHGQSSSSRQDPFAPTPLAHIKNRISHPQQQQPSQQQQQQQQHQLQQGMGGSMSSRGGTTASSSSQIGGIKRELTEEEKRELLSRRQKESFLLFTRVLIKYLSSKDPALHSKTKAIISDCARRNKLGEPGYESVTMAMQRRLKDLVGETYWKKAQELVYYMYKKKKAMQQQADGGVPGQSQSLTSEQRRQLYIEEQKLKQAAMAAASLNSNPAPSIDKMFQEIHQKREEIEKQAPPLPAPEVRVKGTTLTATTLAASPAPAPAATKGKKAPRRKSDGSSKTQNRKLVTASKQSAAALPEMASAPAPVKVVTAIPTKTVTVEPPREYEELMKLIDHAVDYDWPSIGQLLGDEKDLELSEEERLLLYGDSSPMPVNATAATNTEESEDSRNDLKQQQQPIQGTRIVKESNIGALPRPGWGNKNVLSVRAAWSALRLKELKRREAEASSAAPTVAGGTLTLPSNPDATVGSTSSNRTEVQPWINEETAEQDVALALLSDGCQAYLKGVVEKAIRCARQRQNLDGIRLWHQQYAFMQQHPKLKESADKSEGEVDAKTDDKSGEKPPLLLRLGCDVTRQIAQAQGNAALTVKRMEEALERQTGVPSHYRVLDTRTLSSATSMGDLAWRPLLKEGAQKADYQAKRYFAIYGGKESKDPPLGRVPKKAKLLVDDFIMGSNLALDGKYQKAFTASSFISF